MAVVGIFIQLMLLDSNLIIPLYILFVHWMVN